MEFFPSLDTFLSIGPISIKWYAVCILTGVVFCYMLSGRTIKKMGYSQDKFDSLFFGGLIAGIMGARIWYVLFADFSYYFGNPIRILEIWNGGLAIQGGLMAGAAFALWYAKSNKINFFRLADAVLPHVLLAQAAGRWGNFFNQEVYGRVVNESFYRFFPSWFKDIMYIQNAYREPTFLYESVANLIGWALIVFAVSRFKKRKRGDLAYAYLIWYGVIRFFIEGIREDQLRFMGVSTAQVISIIFVVVGVLGVLGVFRNIFKRPKPIILFDFDGTLMDTEEAIIRSFRVLFKNHRPDYPLTREEELSFVGPALVESIPKYFDGNVQELIEEYRQANRELHQEYVKPMENAVKTLSELSEQGYHLGVVSSKFSEVILLGSDMFDMTKYFDVIIGAESVSKLKPDPEGILKACEQLGQGHDQLIYVGDVANDIRAGRNAGAYTVAYQASNSELAERVLEGKPNHVIHDLYEMVELVKEDHEWTYNMM